MNSPTIEQALKLHEAGAFAEAEEIYLNLISETPDNAEAIKLMGVLNCQLQQYDEGIKYLEAAVELDGSNAEFHQVLGHAYLTKGKVEEGIASLTKAGELDPGRAEIYGALGDTYHQIQRFGEALKAYQRALIIQPDALGYLNSAGLCAFFSNQPEVALNYLTRVLSEDDSISSAHYGLALVRGNAGETEQALAHIANALALEPENPEYQRLKAELES